MSVSVFLFFSDSASLPETVKCNSGKTNSPVNKNHARVTWILNTIILCLITAAILLPPEIKKAVTFFVTAFYKLHSL